MKTNIKTSDIVLSALMMCLIMVAIFILRIPVPFTQGYVNLSDGIIFLAVMILGYKYGALSAGLGSMMGDIIGGFAMWAPWTFVIKGIMALIFGLLLQKSKAAEKPVQKVLAMIAGGIFMVFGYFIAEGVMYGSWAIAALGIPWNIGQFAVGIVLALLLETALGKTSFRRYLRHQA